MNAPAEPIAVNAPDIQSEWYEPFPEPRPFPPGWDMSGLIHEAAIDLAETACAAEIMSA